ncbi:DASH complex subunit dad1 domain-containing protein [Rhizoctonia solani AG-1 IA]|uniref:DASH complex subunit DAD1 n=1 Tax=Thanatephorus cucumeris (strain AG1-IA) TaxID=983506 RepID=L8WLE8_THACA|nr:DASH complex subunit dad1 domain-containing protein [Rhizoctonia solani AG-1 IA]
MSTTTAHDEHSFFERERERLIADIASELLSNSNVINRRLEDLGGTGKSFDTVAQLWGSFHNLVREQERAAQDADVLAGTGSRLGGRTSTIFHSTTRNQKPEAERWDLKTDNAEMAAVGNIELGTETRGRAI